MKLTIKTDPTKRKMGAEELQLYLQARRGTGAHKSEKDYSRQKNRRMTNDFNQ